MKVTFDSIRLGDRRRISVGWLIKADGALRGILSADVDGYVHYGFACDRRIAPEDGYMCFRDLAEAQAWIVRRLTTPPDRPRRIGPARRPRPWPRGEWPGGAR